jgi:hypothetical protein
MAEIQLQICPAPPLFSIGQLAMLGDDKLEMKGDFIM